MKTLCVRHRYLVAGMRAGLLSVITAFLISGCAMAPLKSGLAAYDEGEFPKPTATPAWNATLGAEEVDIFRLVPGNKMLVGTLDFGGSFFWAPYDNDLALFDLTDGRKLWQVDRKEAVQGLSEVLLVTPVILTRASSGYVALSVESGAVLWSWRPGESMKYATAGKRSVVFWRAAGEGGASFSARDLMTGAEAWSLEVKGASAKDKPARIGVWDERLFVYGGRIALLDAATGRVQWQMGSPVGQVESIAVSDKYLAACGAGGLVLLDVSNGTTLWKTDGTPIPAIMSISGSAVISAGPAGQANTWTLQAHQEGGRVWSLKLGSPLESVMVFDAAGRPWFTSGGYLYGVDRASGAVVTRSALPDFMTGTRSLPPQVRILEDRAVVAAEFGVAVYSVKTGNRLYEQFVEGAELFSYDYARSRMAMKSVPGGLKYRQVYLPQQQYNDIFAPFNASMQQYVAYVDQYKKSVLESKTSTPSDRMSAMNYSIAVKQTAQAYDSAAASVQMGVSLTMATMSTMQAGIAWRTGHIQHRDRLHRLMVERSYESLNDSLQFGYYLRPWYRDGWGITVVALATGKRADIRHSPYCEPLLIGSAQLPVMTIDPVNRRLLVKGLGLDRSKYVLYAKNACSLEISMFPYRWEMPYPSILAYDLDRMEFGAGGGGMFVKKQGYNDKDRALVEAILEKDEDKVEAAIKAGANVNAQDEYGVTPVFYSVLTNERGINKLLMKNGANPVVCDISGQTPNTWGNLAVPWPTGAAPVLTESNSSVEAQYGTIQFEKRHRACMKKWGHLK